MARGSSPRLIGRGDELGRLRDAVRRAREAPRSVVLVSGEAGIGKSRLLVEFERSLHDDPPTEQVAAWLGGGCVDVGGGLAYLPLIELLDGIRDLGADIEAESTAVRGALGGMHASAMGNDIGAAPAGRAATFLRIRHLLARAASERPVIAVIDDLQWADRSSLDVVLFLARRLVRTGVLLVLAYRSDELGRRHPLRPVLADLERHAALDHVRLGPLSPAEVEAQVTAILGRAPHPARLERVAALADGNPFHVEELLSLDDDQRLPPSLHDVLSARLDQLDDAGRDVVEQAAVIGRRFDPILLTTVSAAPRSEVIGGLRQALDCRVLTPAEDGRQYRFRHALLREAVYSDLSPEDRIEGHRRIARALTDHPELGDESAAVAVADRARHWLAARSAPEAFVALLDAARSATAATAWPEARAAYESALGLWAEIDDPVAVAGMPRSRILEEAAEIAWNEGDSRRSLALNRRAQAEPDVAADPLRLGRLAQREGWLRDDLGDLQGEAEAAQRASRLIPTDPPSEDRAAVLSSLGLLALRRGRIREAITSFEEAIAVCDRIGADTLRAINLAWLATAWANLGELQRPRDAIGRLDKTQAGISSHVVWTGVTTWTPWLWIWMADYGRAIEYADRLLADARSRGMDRSLGLWALAPRALAEFWLGRWGEARASIEQQSDYTWAIDAAVYLRWVAACIAAGMGQPTQARSLAAEAIEIARSGFPEQAIVARVAGAWVELLEDRPDAALEHVRAAWTEAAGWEGLIIRSLVLWIGLWAVADQAARARGQRDGSGGPRAGEFGVELVAAVHASRAQARRAEQPAPDGAGPLLVLELAAAEAARIEGADEAAVWASLGDRFERVGDLPRTVMARQRQAESILRDRGDRAEAIGALQVALEHTETMGAKRLRERVLAVARAARIEPEPRSRGATPLAPMTEEPWGLSRREREVLEMLVDGRTNRQIAEALFISDKTASVHVTHIMHKLGVSHRTEAAIMALRAGIGARTTDGLTPSTSVTTALTGEAAG